MPIYRRRRYSKKKADKSKKKFAARVKRIVGATTETKFWDANGSVSCQTTPALADLTPVTQGDTAINRDGDVISFKSFRINFRLQGQPAATHASDPLTMNPAVRIILLQWRPNDASVVPTAASILASVTALVNLTSPYTMIFHQQFKVLYDKRIVLKSRSDLQVAGASTVVYPDQVMWSVTIPSKKVNRKMIYNLTATAGTNQIYMLYMSDQGLAANAPDLYFYSRLLFTDL